MSIRIYLRDEITHAHRFRQGDGTRKARFGKLEIHRDEHREYYYVPVDERTPEPLEPFVTKATIRMFIPSTPHRTLGVYGDGEESITIDRGEHRDLRVNGSGRSLDQLLGLYRLIRAGKIQPTESWEAPIEDGAPASAPRASVGG